MFTVREDDLSDRQSRDLIALHLAEMDANVPPGAFFLDLSDLRGPDVTVWSAWDGATVASIGALKMLTDGMGEIKSMRTHPAFVGRGAGTRILTTIIDAAKARRLRRLSLETASGPSFQAARSMYAKFGFRKADADAGHERRGFSHVLHLGLDGGREGTRGNGDRPAEDETSS